MGTTPFRQAVDYLVAGASELPPTERAAALREAADLLDPGGGSLSLDFVFEQSGDGWLLSYRGQWAMVRHMSGFSILSFLIDHPDKRYSPADIEAFVEGQVVTISTASSLPSKQERADLMAQRQRLATWRDSLADGHSDLPRIDKAISEIDRQIRGGWSDEYDAARKRAAKSVSIAIQAIKKHLPSLAEYIRRSVQISASGCIFSSITPPGK